MIQEIENRNQAVPFRRISTVYFGGGTPSLAEPHQIAAVLDALRAKGFDLSEVEEITLEANPGTITPSKLKEWRAAGVNRFSIGAQTFDDGILKSLGREHNAADTLSTLDLLSGSGCDYTVDVLFGVPGQSQGLLSKDLDILARYKPLHVSAYCLTLPERHPLQKGRAPEDDQVKMFYQIEDRLRELGLYRYEISNYTVPGKESVHNSLYWTDQNYWGLGMSSHSYFKTKPWGTRFWNPPGIHAYVKQVKELGPSEDSIPNALPEHQREFLAENQALTDFSHTALRTMKGLSELTLSQKFSTSSSNKVLERLRNLETKNWVESAEGVWRISRPALVYSDQIFQEMTFLPSDL